MKPLSSKNQSSSKWNYNMLENGKYSEESTCKMSAKGELIYQEKLINHLNPWVDYYSHLHFEKGCFFTEIDRKKVLIEFEETPLVARSIRKSEADCFAELFPGLNVSLDLKSICFDDEDNFIALTKEKQIPVFIAGNAQNDFFNVCDSFDDDSFQFDGQEYQLPYLYPEEHSKGQSFWNSKYTKNELGWDLGVEHPFLDTAFAQLKLLRSKVLVLGAGRAHDANFFASQGHIVTAIDICPEAIAKAKELYPESDSLKYVCADVFAWEAPEKFDLIWDHTFYCAIPPKMRDELVKKWLEFLKEGGKLTGIFFSMYKPSGPPYGGSERELAARIEGKFNILFWNRVRQGPVERLGKEFFCYMEKR